MSSVHLFLITREISIALSHSALSSIQIRQNFMRSPCSSEMPREPILWSIMRFNKEGGINNISRKFLIICKNYVSYYLKDPFNFCIISGISPNVFKIAQITPTHKKGSLHNISNYRPVSVLSNLSKYNARVLKCLIYLF